MADARIRKMRLRFGPVKGDRKCGDCANLVRTAGGVRVYAKCKIFGISSSESTDWRVKWVGCGAFVDRVR